MTGKQGFNHELLEYFSRTPWGAAPVLRQGNAKLGDVMEIILKMYNLDPGTPVEGAGTMAEGMRQIFAGMARNPLTGAAVVASLDAALEDLRYRGLALPDPRVAAAHGAGLDQSGQEEPDQEPGTDADQEPDQEPDEPAEAADVVPPLPGAAEVDAEHQCPRCRGFGFTHYDPRTGEWRCENCRWHGRRFTVFV